MIDFLLHELEKMVWSISFDFLLLDGCRRRKKGVALGPTSPSFFLP